MLIAHHFEYDLFGWVVIYGFWRIIDVVESGQQRGYCDRDENNGDADGTAFPTELQIAL
jgi:hypothetical protein